MEYSATGAVPSRRISRMIMRSLATGTPLIEGVRYIHVGHTRWIEAQSELLEELAQDEDSDVFFVRGTYGSGKTHFLACVQDHAIETGWAVAHLECARDRAELDRFETVYPKILYKLRSKSMLEESIGKGCDTADIDGGRWFLERWVKGILREAGFSAGPVRRTMEVESRLYRLLQDRIVRTNLPGNLQAALCAYARASLLDDIDLLNELARWFRGDDQPVHVSKSLLQRPGSTSIGPGGTRKSNITKIPPISRSTSLEVLRGVLWLIRETGHRGLVLCIDELEEIAKIGPQKRQDQCFQALREFVDNADGELGLRYLCTYFAATPEMFDSEKYFRRYDALSTRIEPVGDEINWRGSVIDLDRTPLNEGELRQLAEGIRRIHSMAYDWNAVASMSDDQLESLVNGVYSHRSRLAKPRLLCRVLVDRLDQAKAGAHDHKVVTIEHAIRSAAELLLRGSRA